MNSMVILTHSDVNVYQMVFSLGREVREIIPEWSISEIMNVHGFYRIIPKKLQDSGWWKMIVDRDSNGTATEVMMR